MEEREPPEAAGESEHREHQIGGVVVRQRRKQRGDPEDRRAQRDRAARTETPPDERPEERGREYAAGHERQGGVRLSVEGLLEDRRERPDVGEEEEDAEDSEGDLAEHRRGPIGP